MLRLFWEQHHPVRPAFRRQYMSAIFWADDEQRRLAEESKAQRAAELGREIVTELLPLERFWLAEGYHQKYSLRHDPLLMGALSAVYDEPAFVDSTVAARLNGMLDGHGTAAQLAAEVDGYGLPAEAVTHLRRLVRG
ncbi:MAG: hypothetical protein NVS3B10_03650 [Polyangiales bacterium]